MIASFAAWLDTLRRRRTVCLLGALLLVAACGVWFSQHTAREDIRVLIPDDDSRLAEQFTAMRDAPFMHVVSITVGGPGSEPKALATALAAALQGPAMIFAVTGPGGAFTPAALPTLVAALPALLPPEGARIFAESLDAEGVVAAMRATMRQLLGPSGPALRGLAAADPLRLHAVFLRSLSGMGSLAGMAMRDGYFLDKSGMYGMVLAKPLAPMTDAAASVTVLDQVRTALADLPAGTEGIITGSYRHSEANADTIKDDLSRILPASLALLAGLFLFFVRNRRAVVIFVVPLAALCVAGAVTTLVYGAVSGIVIGFGSVILGITADYAIHTYYALARPVALAASGAGRDAGRDLARLLPPLMAGACTTACAFAALFFSSIPAIRQLAFFGLAGIGSALAMSVFVLPLLFRSLPLSALSGAAQGQTPPPLPPDSPRPRPALAAALAGFFILVCLAAGLSVRVDGDIRNLSYQSPAVVSDEARASAIWQTPTEGSFLVVSSGGGVAGFEDALRKNDRVWEVLRAANTPASSLSPFLPSRERQEKNLAAWRAMWAERGPAVLTALDATGTDLGFAPDAFAPFKAWVGSEGEAITAERLDNLGLGFLPAMLSSRVADHARVYTMLPPGYTPEPALAAALDEVGALYVSGTTFRSAMAEAIGGDMFRFCLLTVLAVVVAVGLMFRSLFRCLAVLLPMLAGLAFTLALLALSGLTVTMFHAVALPLVIALSVDYGIFMQAVIEGRMDPAGKKGILLSALTTLAGFGCLLLARHPALFSLGMGVGAGIVAALAAAFWVQPLLFHRGRA